MRSCSGPTELGTKTDRRESEREREGGERNSCMDVTAFETPPGLNINNAKGRAHSNTITIV